MRTGTRVQEKDMVMREETEERMRDREDRREERMLSMISALAGVPPTVQLNQYLAHPTSISLYSPQPHFQHYSSSPPNSPSND